MWWRLLLATTMAWLSSLTARGLLGWNAFGRASPPPGLYAVTAVDAGYAHGNTTDRFHLNQALCWTMLRALVWPEYNVRIIAMRAISLLQRLLIPGRSYRPSDPSALTGQPLL
jgi:hypothetical protein